MKALSQALNSTVTSEIVTVEFGNPLRDKTNPVGIKHLSMNRERSKPHIKELAEDMVTNGFTTVATVFENKTGTNHNVPGLEEGAFYIVDGSHRLEAANEAGVEFRYMLISPKISITSLKDLSDKLIALNDKSKVWGAKDYIEHYTKIGLSDYSILQSILKEFAGLQMRTIACYLSSGKIDEAKSNIITKELRNGTFKIKTDVEKAKGLFKDVEILRTGLKLNPTAIRDFNIFLISAITKTGASYSVEKYNEIVVKNVSKITTYCSMVPAKRDESLNKLFKVPKPVVEKTSIDVPASVSVPYFGTVSD